MVPQARRPGAKDGSAPGTTWVYALQVPPTPFVAMSLTTADEGCWPVNVLPSSELLTETDWSPLGVTVQVQQESNSPTGSKAYKETQRLPCEVLEAEAPSFVRLMMESPWKRFAA